MDEQTNEQAVRELFSAFGRGDIPGAVALLAEDVEWRVPGGAEVPYAGVRHGHEGVTAFFQALGGAVEFEQFAVTEILCDEDRVVVLGQELGRVRATGRVFENEWVMVFTVRSGRIAELRLYEDTAAVAAAFHDGE